MPGVKSTACLLKVTQPDTGESVLVILIRPSSSLVFHHHSTAAAVASETKVVPIVFPSSAWQEQLVPVIKNFHQFNMKNNCFIAFLLSFSSLSTALANSLSLSFTHHSTVYSILESPSCSSIIIYLLSPYKNALFLLLSFVSLTICLGKSLTFFISSHRHPESPPATAMPCH